MNGAATSVPLVTPEKMRGLMHQPGIKILVIKFGLCRMRRSSTGKPETVTHGSAE